ncbi:bifunctional phosphopantothenoylcysteine decarboxylase/phosphopantothenate--cysteine ligase CoaBC [bacterium]|nr:bifunctional phosphopantothenoylcysteine decarboxylase/phosphopantothenate--cysteine ligase CoaBC [bacterium]
MKKVILGVCSSISLYKACEIVRLFQKKKCPVQVIMTQNATRLVSPLLFGYLTGKKALVDLFEDSSEEKITHVDLAQKTSLYVVAPATANMLGKFSSGIADDFLSTFYTAVTCPVLVAPAMNEAMYFHTQTQLNIKRLKSLGVRFVEPGKGPLACKEEGWGRLANPQEIVEEGMKLLKQRNSLKGKTVLVTAGPTREFLDPVRFLSNRSSGKMGYELASEALSRGAEVIYITGPTSLWLPPRAQRIRVNTAQQMKENVERFFDQTDILIMAAAVSDFKFEETAVQKIKKKDMKKRMELVPTPDVLKDLAPKKGDKTIVGFAAETKNVQENALEKIKKKHMDMIVANDVSQKGVGFESDLNRVLLLFPDGQRLDSGLKSKSEISRDIIDKIEEIIEKKGR